MPAVLAGALLFAPVVAHADDPCPGRYGPGTNSIPPTALGYSCNSGYMNGAYIVRINGHDKLPITVRQGDEVTLEIVNLPGPPKDILIALTPNGGHNGFASGAASLSNDGNVTRVYARIYKLDYQFPQAFNGTLLYQALQTTGGKGLTMITVPEITVLPSSAPAPLERIPTPTKRIPGKRVQATPLQRVPATPVPHLPGQHFTHSDK